MINNGLITSRLQNVLCAIIPYRVYLILLVQGNSCKISNLNRITSNQKIKSSNSVHYPKAQQTLTSGNKKANPKRIGFSS